MSKKIFFFINLIFLTLNANIAKSNILDGFLFKPAFSIEYQAPEINAKALNDHFETEPFEKQLKKFDNIALGLNFRIHKYFGLNLNWSQFALENDSQNGYLLENKSDLTIKNVNFSSLFYFPIIGETLDGFVEVGASDINYDFKFVDDTSTQHIFKDHETSFLYGAGIEFSPYNSTISFRLSAQRYITKLQPINGDIVTWRGGLIKYF